MNLNPLAFTWCLVCLAATAAAQERTSANDPALKAALDRYPEADADKDGVLTFTEAAAHRQKLRQQQLAPDRLPKPNHANIAYGPHERNVLDLWLTTGKEDDSPRPLVVFIHGGGWIGGDKAMLSPHHLKRFLDAGLHVASINYRFSTQSPFPAPLRDGGLAVQFLRAHAWEYGVDPKRIAAYGASAGAVTSLYLAFHDDMADPDAADPVLRQSTRLTCAGSIVGPTTLDKKTMDEWFGMKVVTHHAFFPLFQVADEAELYSDRVRALAAEGSPIALLSKDDPPVFLDFPQDLASLPAKHSAGEMVHHPLFGLKLKEAMDRLGVEANFQAENKPQDRYEDLPDFLIAKLAGAR